MKELDVGIHILGANSKLAMAITDHLQSRRIQLKNYGRSPGLGIIQIEDYEVAADRIGEGETALISFAISSPRRCQIESEMSYEVNVTKTNRVIRRVLDRGGRVIFLSSDVVYGSTTKEVDEQAELRPIGNYGRQKALVETTWLGVKGFTAIRTSLNLSGRNELVRKIISGDDVVVLENMYRNLLLASDLGELIYSILKSHEKYLPSVLNAGGTDLVNVSDYFTRLASLLQKNQVRISSWDDIDKSSKPKCVNLNSALACSILKRPFVSIDKMLPKR